MAVGQVLAGITWSQCQSGGCSRAPPSLFENCWAAGTDQVCEGQQFSFLAGLSAFSMQFMVMAYSPSKVYSWALWVPSRMVSSPSSVTALNQFPMISLHWIISTSMLCQGTFTLSPGKIILLTSRAFILAVIQSRLRR